MMIFLYLKTMFNTSERAATHHGSAILHHIEPNDAQERPKAQLGEQRKSFWFIDKFMFLSPKNLQSVLLFITFSSRPLHCRSYKRRRLF